MRPHWYFITTETCPQCGHTREFRERRFTPRPKDWAERHEVLERWDYCD